MMLRTPVILCGIIGYVVCPGLEDFDTVAKVKLNGVWNIDLKGSHNISNIIATRSYTDGSLSNFFTASVKSDGKLHIDIHDRRFINRTNISLEGSAVSIEVSNLKFSDGGSYNFLVSTVHDNFRKYYKLYVLGKPTAPTISLRYPGNYTVNEGGFMRLICISESITSPRSPDCELKYTFYVNGQNAAEVVRYMVGGNELMIAGIVPEDNHLNVSCLVSEEVEGFYLSSKTTRTFRLQVLKPDDSSSNTQMQSQRIQDSCTSSGPRLTAITVVTLLATILTTCFYFLGVALL